MLYPFKSIKYAFHMYITLPNFVSWLKKVFRQHPSDQYFSHYHSRKHIHNKMAYGKSCLKHSFKLLEVAKTLHWLSMLIFVLQISQTLQSFEVFLVKWLLYIIVFIGKDGTQVWLTNRLEDVTEQ